DRIEADRGIVEEKDARPMQQPPSQMEPLLHSPRVALNALSASGAEVDEIQQFLYSGGDLARRDRVELGEVAEIVPSRKAVLETALTAEDEADPASDFLGIAHNVQPHDRRRARCRDEKRREHLDGRCLAGTIRPEDSEELALADVQREAIEAYDP